MTFLTDPEKARLSRWVYSVKDKSLTTRLFTPLWNYWVTLVPDNVAPNVLTLAGLVCQLQAFYLCVMYMHQWPRLVSAAACLLTVTYQTLDAIDGKHARNIRNSGPLGELFDHACDNVGSVFMIATLAACVGCTDVIILWFLVQAAQLLFLQSHVDAFKSGVVEFGLLTGPGEVLLVLELVMFGQATLRIPLQEWLPGFWQHAVDLALTAVFPAAHHDAIMAMLSDPRLIVQVLFGGLLLWAVVKAIGLGAGHYSTRNGLLLCYLFRAAPLLMLHQGHLVPYGLREVCLDGLFMSIVTSDIIVAKLAGRELHPFVVIFAMISVINNLSVVIMLVFYYVTLFYEISQYMNIPIFSVWRNVYVDGVYDLCHVGHKKQMLNALEFGNRLVVGVVSDENVYKYKAKKPVMSTAERVAEVEALRFVSQVIPDAPCPAPSEWRQAEGLEPTAPILDEAFLRKHHIHVVAHGEEYLPENMAPGSMDYYIVPRKMGICRALPRTPGISTTDLMKRMQARVTAVPPATPAAAAPSATPTAAAPPATPPGVADSATPAAKKGRKKK